MEGKIKVEDYEGNACIESTTRIQMYAGDRGTEVCTTVIMTPDELKTHIASLVKIWRKIK